jgi:hypothetical protein
LRVCAGFQSPALVSSGLALSGSHHAPQFPESGRGAGVAVVGGHGDEAVAGDLPEGHAPEAVEANQALLLVGQSPPAPH